MFACKLYLYVFELNIIAFLKILFKSTDFTLKSASVNADYSCITFILSQYLVLKKHKYTKCTFFNPFQSIYSNETMRA